MTGSATTTDALLLEGITKRFGPVTALDDVSLAIRQGEIHALVGENGAGKSTLMAVASGALVPEEGTVRFFGEALTGHPGETREKGLAIVRQEPSLMPDLTVAENIHVGLPARLRPGVGELSAFVRERLAFWREDHGIDPGARIESLLPEKRFIVEIVKAIASEPRLLILDEPTEHLSGRDVTRLFEVVRELAAKGCAVVYISHRIREVREIAERISVLRSGRQVGTRDAHHLDEDDIIALIVGRRVERPFPPKAGPGETGERIFELHGVSGPGFRDIVMRVDRGEIVGLAGIDGHGQRELMRALAGQKPVEGRINVAGRLVKIASPRDARRAGIRFVPGDRHREGLLPGLSVRENFSVRSIEKDTKGGVISMGAEKRRAREALGRLDVKMAGIEAPITSLSGGNAQKVILTSVMAGDPEVLLLDEPTQGVDVGARAEIYSVMRQAAREGMSQIVVSSDRGELVGLCDRVYVFSRGQIVAELSGDRVNDDAIAQAMMTATNTRAAAAEWGGRLARLGSSDWAPFLMLAAAILILGAVAGSVNPYFLTERSLTNLMAMTATLAMVAYGQHLLMLTGGIDLSVGPLMGLCAVTGSFFLSGDPWLVPSLGWASILVVAAMVGAVNFVLAGPLKLHPMVATLATYMAVQAVSLLLRPVPAGMTDFDILDILGHRFGPVPASFAVAVVAGILLDLALMRSGAGIRWRAFGSNGEAARVAGIRPMAMQAAAYIGCSVLTALAAIMMIEQVAIGDPRAGMGYTLTSIAAVVIGGTALRGGRGLFVGSLLGALFISLINSAATFLQLDPAWQNYLLGGLIILAVAFYSYSRSKAVSA
ncbi:ATP-binding cassette domain-containing protein [Mangrovicoccus sp. HB161399]|uniref:ATP-binding cassette domain-containing protein n=1 Tax=Mangrovicoccus sp. HB161399 TaxID=2720392 RepID=UPI00155512FE|nr:ATP-binding cassette domain-containing protein [Mangrovicoccus sp. HB161399]